MTPEQLYLRVIATVAAIALPLIVSCLIVLLQIKDKLK